MMTPNINTPRSIMERLAEVKQDGRLPGAFSVMPIDSDPDTYSPGGIAFVVENEDPSRTVRVSDTGVESADKDMAGRTIWTSLKGAQAVGTLAIVSEQIPS